MKKLIFYILVILISLTACAEDNPKVNTNTSERASIVSVSVSGSETNYVFNVGISSIETGCDQYADWWEVISEDGALLYRRILAHSHVNEQPFVRAGGTIAIQKDQIVIIRAHMNTSGYGTDVFKGSVSQGFTKNMLTADFANELSNQAPLPNRCAF